MAVKRSGKGMGQRIEVIGFGECKTTARLSEAGYLALTMQNGDEILLNRDEAREFAPVLTHFEAHGTLWADPAPLKRVRCRVKVGGETYDAEGYDEECDHLPLAVFWRNENGAIVNEAFDRTEVTDLEYITG